MLDGRGVWVLGSGAGHFRCVFKGGRSGRDRNHVQNSATVVSATKRTDVSQKQRRSDQVFKSLKNQLFHFSLSFSYRHPALRQAESIVYSCFSSSAPALLLHPPPRNPIQKAHACIVRSSRSHEVHIHVRTLAAPLLLVSFLRSAPVQLRLRNSSHPRKEAGK